MRLRIPRSQFPQLGLVLAVVLVLLGAPAVVLASHVWNDVATDNSFHTDTAAVGLAGISTGCGGGDFCPNENVTRAQEAAFMHRGLGRAARDTGAGTIAPGVATEVTSLTVTPGYTSGKIAGANGFLKIDGAVTLYEDAADACDCFFNVVVYVDGVYAGATQYLFLENDGDDQLGSGAITTVYPISANGPRTVTLEVQEYVGNENVDYWASMTALYVPFGSTGLDVLAGAGADAEQAAEGTRPGE